MGQKYRNGLFLERRWEKGGNHSCRYNNKYLCVGINCSHQKTIATASCFPQTEFICMIWVKEAAAMETKNIILKLRMQKGLSQDELAEKIMVTRQAVSRWENGETVPNTETLKLLSKEFDVSINTLLGEPRKLICQCCGMPIEDESILGRDKDGTLNEEYCKWCYADGTYTYSNMDDLID